MMERPIGTVANEGNSDADVSFHIRNPSVRLHLTVRVFCRPGVGSADTHDYSGETWQLYAVAEGQPETRLNFVFGDGASPPAAVAQNLPDSYEVETGIKVVQGVAHLHGPHETPNPAGTYYVQCTWEAAENGMSLEELQALYALCDLTVDNQNEIPDILG